MKNKVVLWVAALSGVVCLLQGCGALGEYDDLINDIETEQETREYMPDTRQPVTDTDEEASGRTEYSPMDFYYGYNQLTSLQQTLYLEMLGALSDMEDDVNLSTIDDSQLDLVFNCLMYDHPELFYVEGYKYNKHMYGDTVTGITFSGSYTMGKEQMGSTKAILDSKINECLMYAPDVESYSGDEYPLVKYLYEWVIDNTQYNKDSENNQNICSVFLQGESVCQGYAKAMQYLLQKSGIECFIVVGFTGDTRHAWNIAKINGNYYYIDPTWGDASYNYNGIQSSYDFAPSINYDYFMVTTSELTRTHSIEYAVVLPECDSIDDNYFVREGLYFTEYDEDKLKKIFDSYASREAGYVTIKCSDDSYGDIVSKLIDSQKVFDFIDDRDTKILYTTNNELNTVTFWNIY